jgi:ATP-binding cassette subfamily B protein
VSFAYPATEMPVLSGVNLTLPAGSVVAIVGENGAGKTTLVKLLCKFYDATSGEVAVDGVSLRNIDPVAWRRRISAGFQDFVKFELMAHDTVGIGDIPRIQDTVAVATALSRAGAEGVLDGLPAGAATQLGRSWPDGVDLSVGQWQKLALSRALMRDDPLLLVLDEPTSALDPMTENLLFERFAAASRKSSSMGSITILVSHRFSTVRMADLIVVVDGGRVREAGSHGELLARGDLYAELYEMQASAYR